MDMNAILADVLKEFQELAKIPRPSGHEKRVSNYIAQKLSSMGLEVSQDEYNNVIADKKAADGFATAPLVMLQSHMDMVCVAEEGIKYDPLHDPIKVKNNGEFLFAEGTSLGADDGIGVASIFYLMAQNFAHGPLRAVFTVDEEQGMSGARGLDKKYLDGVSYIINCDSEDYDVVTVASAGSVHVGFEREFSFCHAEKGYQSVRIGLKNLLGGHSGTEIDKNRCNAIKALAFILRGLQEENIEFVLSQIKGGTADNAIASEAFADVVYKAKDEQKIASVLEQQKKEFEEVYGEIEKNVVFIFEKIDTPSDVLSTIDTKLLIALLCVLHSGVYAMSQKVKGLPELSANVGRLNLEAGKIVIHLLARSATNANLSFIKRTYKALAGMSGFNAVFAPTSPAWNGDPDSKLTRIMTETFAEQNNKKMRVECIHGGLECNYFADKKPDVDIVSIGPNNLDIHTPQERLQLDTVVPQILLMKEVLTKIARGGK